MNIVIQDANCAPHYVRNSWARVFNSCGHRSFLWQKESCPTFDLFNQIKPIDLLIINTYDVDEATCRCIKNNQETRVIMFASAWGDLIDKMNKEEYPIVRVSDNEKRILGKLKKETGKPDYVFIHTTPNYMQETMGGWNEIGIRPVSILNGADTFSYLGAVEKEEYKSDISFIGGRWPFKAKNIDRLLLPLCEFPSKYKIKIFGNTPWPVNQYLGQIHDDEVKHVFKSAIVCPNISEPHSYIYSDLVERLWKIPLSDGLVVSDKACDLYNIFANGYDCLCPTFDSPKELSELVDYYNKEFEIRQHLIWKQKRCILNHGTYFHRCSKMFFELDLFDESKKILDVYKLKYKDLLEEYHVA